MIVLTLGEQLLTSRVVSGKTVSPRARVKILDLLLELKRAGYMPPDWTVTIRLPRCPWPEYTIALLQLLLITLLRDDLFRV